MVRTFKKPVGKLNVVGIATDVENLNDLFHGPLKNEYTRMSKQLRNNVPYFSNIYLFLPSSSHDAFHLHVASWSFFKN